MRDAATTAPPVVSRLSPLLPVRLEFLERNTESRTLACLTQRCYSQSVYFFLPLPCSAHTNKHNPRLRVLKSDGGRG